MKCFAQYEAHTKHLMLLLLLLSLLLCPNWKALNIYDDLVWSY